MWFKPYLTIICLHFSWAFATRALGDTGINNTARGDADRSSTKESPDSIILVKGSPITPPTIPVGKTEILCFSNTNRTTVEDAEAYIRILRSLYWFSYGVTWSRNVHGSPGHLPLRIRSGTTQFMVFPKGDTYASDVVALIDYVKVLQYIVKDCIAKSQYTGGKAYIGVQGVVGITLSGLSDDDLTFGSNSSLMNSA